MKRTEQDRPSDREAIEATAAAWLAERGGGLTPARAAEFARWRAADPRHEAAVARLEATWSALQHLRELRPKDRRSPDPDLLVRKFSGDAAPPPRLDRKTAARAPRLHAAAAVAMAASLAFAAAWWVAVRTPHRGPAPAQEYAAAADGYEQVTLEDGSVLELNAGSEVAVKFTLTERRVRLVRGEAHFTVAKNPARPFEVEAGTVAVRAVGTAFNVRVGSSNVEVLVTEGKVAVANPAGPALPVAASASEPTDHRLAGARRYGLPTSVNPTLVAAYERTVVPITPSVVTAPPVVEKITPEVLRDALAWRTQRLHFADTPLAEVVAQFNRRNAVQLELADTGLATVPVGGSFRADNVDTFVRLLTADNEIVAERPEPGRIILRRR